jgi:hypothetical protein
MSTLNNIHQPPQITIKLILLMGLSLFLMGCRTAPLVDVSGEPITSGTGKSVSLSQVTHDIIQAGVGLGWTMKKQKSGYIIGQLNLRKHMIKVNIHYSNKEYSITYNDSSEMSYDGTQIHSNYNSWVQNLNKAIRTNVFNNN